MPAVSAPSARALGTGQSRALGVETAPSRADFADHLSKARSRRDDLAKPAPDRADDPPRADADPSPGDAAPADASAPADRPEGDGSADDAPSGDQTAAAAPSPAPGTPPEPDAVAGGSAGQTDSSPVPGGPGEDGRSQAPQTGHELAVALATRPITITILNQSLLQGATSPRFTLVAPELRPGAVPAPANDAAPSATAPPSPDVHPAGSTTAAAPAPPPPPTDPTQADTAGASPPDSARSTARPQTDGRSADVAASPAPTATSAEGRPASAVGQPPHLVAEAQIAAPRPEAVDAAPRRATDPRTAPDRAATAGPATAAPAGNHAVQLLDRLTPASARPDSPQPARQPDADPAAFAAQVQRGLAQALTQGGSTSVTLRLQPAALGSLKIQLHVDKASVRARFETTAARTRDLLASSAASLKSSLTARGLIVSDVTVALAPALPTPPLTRDPGAIGEPATSPSSPSVSAHPAPPTPHASRHTPLPGTPLAKSPESPDGGGASPGFDLDLSLAPAVGDVRYTLTPDGHLALSALA